MKLDIFKFMQKRTQREGKLVQSRLPEDLHTEMLAAFEEARTQGYDASWQSFIESACRAFLETQGR